MVTKHKMKNTEIGFIPEDWDICSIDNEFTFIKSNSLSREQLNYAHGSVANIHYGDILTKFGENIDIKRTQLPLINHSAEFTPSPKDILKTGDIILADTAEDETAGKACEVIGITNESIVAGLHTIAMRPKQIHFAPGYLGYTLNASYYHDQLRPLMQGTKVISISKKALQETCIIYPRDINEQRAIVNALTDIDTIIARLKEAIEKKKQIKEGAMQRLLTGKVRLKGYTDKWISAPLKDLGHLNKISIDPQQYPDTYFVEYSMPAYDNDRQPERKLGSEMNSNRTIIDGTCLLINKLNVRQQRIWLVNQCEENSVCSSEFLPFKSDTCDLAFIGHVMRSTKTTSDLIDMSTGTSNSQRRVAPKDLMAYSITIPASKEEQHEIAKILTTMDSEISALKAERDKYISIKQGMMQKLLTGQIRLPQSCLKEE